MFKITPYSMSDGKITAISIADGNFNDVIEISPISFDIFIQENTKKVVSVYYLKKKNCENLMQQLELAKSEFEEAKNNFDSLIHTIPEKEEIHVDDVVVKIEPPKEIIKVRIISPPEHIKPIEEPIPEEKPLVPEPISALESIESTPPEVPKSLEEITESIINSDDFKSLISNNQLSDNTMKSLISKNTKPELVDTIHEMVITQLKEKGVIEPSLVEKITKKVRGRKKKE